MVMDEITISIYLAALIEVCALGMLSRFRNQLYHKRVKSGNISILLIFIVLEQGC